MDFREALQAGKIGIGGASDHWTRLFGQKVLGGYAQGYAEGAIASFNDGAKDAPVDKLLVAITPVQSGTGDPSPDNIRPISGWTGAQVVRSGKNLFVAKDPLSGKYIRAQTGEINSSSAWNCSPIYSPIKGGVSYTINRSSSSPSSVAGFAFYDENKEYISGTSYGSWTTRTITAPENARYFRASWSENADNPIMLIPSGAEVPTAYAPYTGTTYPITFPSEAGTVYGGELDVTSGVLTVDRAWIEFKGDDEETWLLNEMTDVYQFYCQNVTVQGAQGSSCYSNIAPYGVTSATRNRYRYGCYLLFSGTVVAFQMKGSKAIFDSISTWKQHLAEMYANGTPVCAVYTLATPITYQLTPTEVTTLLGVNNIWADTGDVKVWYKKKR